MDPNSLWPPLQEDDEQEPLLSPLEILVDDPRTSNDRRFMFEVAGATGTSNRGGMSYAAVNFINLTRGKIFYKRQYRKDHKTRQLVKDGGHGLIKMQAKTNGQLIKILGWVKREEKAAKYMNDFNGEVPIKNEYDGEMLNLIKETDVQEFSEDGYTSQPFSVDLHEIYDGNASVMPDGKPGKPVFELARWDKDQKRNLFQLVIQLVFIDGSVSRKFLSPIFILRTEKENPPIVVVEPPRDNNLGKRPKIEDDDGNVDQTGRRNHPCLLVDTLEAKTAKIGSLVANHISTKNADLAYHMVLKEPDNYDDLEEGDIIGFYEDEESGGTYIERLRSDNIQNALHAGVVSRSYWLDGNKPLNPDTKTDTICVIGIVDVKVVGSIENGERIYASPNNPGKAIPQSHMPVGSFLRKKHVLLGMAMETKKNIKTFDDVQLVKCFVCIVLDVSRKELLEEIEELYEVNEKRTEEKIKISNKRNWKKLKRYGLSTLLTLGVIFFILYQWLIPGSMFRYYICRWGSIPDHHLSFSYEDTRRFDVDGIEFTWEGLQNKIGMKFPRKNNDSSTSYHLNVDRCAYYWDYGVAGNNIGGRKYIGGPSILSVTKNCSDVYKLIWPAGDPYWEIVHNTSNVKCIPRMKY